MYLMLQASDPDMGDGGQLVYSLVADSPYFDVEPSSGLVYVVSAAGLSGQLAEVEVRATDPRGLNATAKVEVSVVHGAGNPHTLCSDVASYTKIDFYESPRLVFMKNIKSKTRRH